MSTFEPQVFHDTFRHAYSAVIPATVPDYYLQVYAASVPEGDMPYVVSERVSCGNTGISAEGTKIAAAENYAGPLLAVAHCETEVDPDDWVRLSEWERWNVRAMTLFGHASLRTLANGGVVHGALPRGRVPYTRPSVPDAWTAILEGDLSGYPPYPYVCTYWAPLTGPNFRYSCTLQVAENRRHGLWLFEGGDNPRVSSGIWVGSSTPRVPTFRAKNTPGADGLNTINMAGNSMHG